jgi:hypothetical protein
VVGRDPAEEGLVPVGEVLGQQRPIQHLLQRVADRRPSARGVERAANSSCTDSSTITVPRLVHRWPAVPKPENSAPSTARSRSASRVITMGFLPAELQARRLQVAAAQFADRAADVGRAGEPDLADQAGRQCGVQAERRWSGRRRGRR